MNKKDYKAIAEIIERITGVYACDNSHDCFVHEEIRNKLSEDLADYFDKENKEELDRTEERFKAYKLKNESFNKKQFLLDCGVEE